MKFNITVEETEQGFFAILQSDKGWNRYETKFYARREQAIGDAQEEEDYWRLLIRGHALLEEINARRMKEGSDRLYLPW
jgi:hypothetical protein